MKRKINFILSIFAMLMVTLNANAWKFTANSPALGEVTSIYQIVLNNPAGEGWLFEWSAVPCILTGPNGSTTYNMSNMDAGTLSGLPSSSEELTTPGTYTLTIPANTFHLSVNWAQGEGNEACTFTWTIPGATGGGDQGGGDQGGGDQGGGDQGGGDQGGGDQGDEATTTEVIVFKAGDLSTTQDSDISFTSNGVTVDVTNTDNTSMRMWFYPSVSSIGSYSIYVIGNQKNKISISSDKNIRKIVFETGMDGFTTIDYTGLNTGSLDGLTWTGNSKEVSFLFTEATYIGKITVLLEGGEDNPGGGDEGDGGDQGGDQGGEDDPGTVFPGGEVGTERSEYFFQAGVTAVPSPIVIETTGARMTTVAGPLVDVGYNTYSNKELNFRMNTKLVFTAKDNITKIVFEADDANSVKAMPYVTVDKGTYTDGVWTGSLAAGQVLTMTNGDGFNIRSIQVCYNGAEEEKPQEEEKGEIAITYPANNSNLASIADGAMLCKFTTTKEYEQVIISLANNDEDFRLDDFPVRMFDNFGEISDNLHVGENTVYVHTPSKETWYSYNGDTYTLTVKGYVNIEDDEYDAIATITINGTGKAHEVYSDYKLVSVSPETATDMNPSAPRAKLTKARANTVTLYFDGEIGTVSAVIPGGMGGGNTPLTTAKADATGKVWNITIDESALGTDESLTFDVTAKDASGHTVKINNNRSDRGVSFYYDLVEEDIDPTVEMKLGTPVFSVANNATNIDSSIESITMTYPDATGFASNAIVKVTGTITDGEDIEDIENIYGTIAAGVALPVTLEANKTYTLEVEEVVVYEPAADDINNYVGTYNDGWTVEFTTTDKAPEEDPALGTKRSEYFYKAGETAVSTPIVIETTGARMTTVATPFMDTTIDVGYNTYGNKELNWKMNTKLVFTAKDNITKIVFEADDANSVKAMPYVTVDKGTYTDGVWTGNLAAGQVLTMTNGDGFNIRSIQVCYNGAEEEKGQEEEKGEIAITYPANNSSLASIANGAMLCKFTTTKEYEQVVISLTNNDEDFRLDDFPVRMFDNFGENSDNLHVGENTVYVQTPSKETWYSYNGDTYTLTVKGYVNIYDEDYDAIATITINGTGKAHEVFSDYKLVSVSPETATDKNPGATHAKLTKARENTITLTFDGEMSTVSAAIPGGQSGVNIPLTTAKADATGKVWNITVDGNIFTNEDISVSIDITANDAAGHAVVLNKDRADHGLTLTYDVTEEDIDPTVEIKLGTPAFSVANNATIDSSIESITMTYPDATGFASNAIVKVTGTITDGEDIEDIENIYGTIAAGVALPVTLEANKTYTLEIEEVVVYEPGADDINNYVGTYNDGWTIEFTTVSDEGGDESTERSEYFFQAGVTAVSTPVVIETEGARMTTVATSFMDTTIDVGYNTYGNKELNWKMNTKLIFTAKDNITKIVFEADDANSVKAMPYVTVDKGTYTDGVWTGSLAAGQVLTMTNNDGFNIRSIQVCYNGAEEDKSQEEEKGEIAITYPANNSNLASISDGARLCVFTTTKEYEQVTISLTNNNEEYRLDDFPVRMFDNNGENSDNLHVGENTVYVHTPDKTTWQSYNGDTYTLTVKGFVKMADVLVDAYDAVATITINGTGKIHEVYSDYKLVSVSPETATDMNPTAPRAKLTKARTNTVTLTFDGAIGSVSAVIPGGMGGGSTALPTAKADATGKVWNITIDQSALGTDESLTFDVTAKDASNHTVKINNNRSDRGVSFYYDLVDEDIDPSVEMKLGTPVFSIDNNATGVDAETKSIMLTFPQATGFASNATVKVNAALISGDDVEDIENIDGTIAAGVALPVTLEADKTYTLEVYDVSVFEYANDVNNYVGTYNDGWTIEFTTTSDEGGDEGGADESPKVIVIYQQGVDPESTGKDYELTKDGVTLRAVNTATSKFIRDSFWPDVTNAKGIHVIGNGGKVGTRIELESEQNIVKVELEKSQDSLAPDNVSSGSFDGMVWTGSTKLLTFQSSSNVYLSKITVYLEGYDKVTEEPTICGVTKIIDSILKGGAGTLTDIQNAVDKILEK